jgi:double-stranded uracil-DNA glycosylase
VERATVAIYEDRGHKWAESAGKEPARIPAAEAFGLEIAGGRLRMDLGCGAGRYTASLGGPCIGVDAARSMLDLCGAAVPQALLVQADLEALPFGPRSIHGAWANMSYLHIPKKRLPFALAELHAMLAVGSPVDIQVLNGEFEGTGLPDDRLGGRFFAAWNPEELRPVLTGAGFDVQSTETAGEAPSGREVLRARSTRLRTLADTVGPGMKILVCGLNPSVYSADAGIGFARPGNRFWPAALASGLVTRPRDTRRALAVDRVGMTDLVKRATPKASDLTASEYRTGAGRVEKLVSWLRPAAVLFVGLAGWRAAVDPGAAAGEQGRPFGGRPAYVMPSTSGLNAHSQVPELTQHMRRALRLAEAAS